MARLEVLRAAAIVASCVALCSCNTLQNLEGQETKGPGGLPGAIESKVLLPADTHQMRVFRASELFAILSDIGTLNVTAPNDQAYFVNAEYQTNQDINYEVTMIKTPCNGGGTNNMTTGCAQLLEAYEATVLEPDLITLAKFALPVDKLQQFLSEAEQSNILGSFETAASVGGTLLLEFHHGAAINRSSIEIAMQWSPAPPSTFAEAEAAFAKNPGAVSGFAPTADAVNAMYNVALRACTALASRMPDSAKDPLKGKALAADEKTCNFNAAS